jgi:hypothetical protein
VYACRLGEKTAYRLMGGEAAAADGKADAGGTNASHTGRPAEPEGPVVDFGGLAVLEDADGAGSVLVGRVADDRQSIAWHLRPAGGRPHVWMALGTTDLDEKISQDLLGPPQGFALWRSDRPGCVRAAFPMREGLIVQELRLPEVRP